MVDELASFPNYTTITTPGMVGGDPVSVDFIIPDEATDSFDFGFSIDTSMIGQDINIALVIDTSGSTIGDSGSNVDGVPGNETFLELNHLPADAGRFPF